MATQDTHIPTAAPIDSDSAGRGGGIASHAVMRVICSQTESSGTGFLNQSASLIGGLVQGKPAKRRYTRREIQDALAIKEWLAWLKETS